MSYQEFLRANPQYGEVTGPGAPPPGFVGDAAEWLLYWRLGSIFMPEREQPDNALPEASVFDKDGNRIGSIGEDGIIDV